MFKVISQFDHYTKGSVSATCWGEPLCTAACTATRTGAAAHPTSPVPPPKEEVRGREGTLGAGWGALSPTSSSVPALPSKWQGPSRQQHHSAWPPAGEAPVGSTESPTLSDPDGTSSPRPRPRSGHPQHPATRDPPARTACARASKQLGPRARSAPRKPDTLSRKLRVASTEPSRAEHIRTRPSLPKRNRVRSRAAE